MEVFNIVKYLQNLQYSTHTKSLSFSNFQPLKRSIVENYVIIAQTLHLSCKLLLQILTWSNLNEFSHFGDSWTESKPAWTA